MIYLIKSAIITVLATNSVAQVQFQKPTWQDVTGQNVTGQNVTGQNVTGQKVGQPSDTQPSSQFSFARESQPVETDSQSSSSLQSSRSTGPELIVTRQTAFGVPFSINPDSPPVREVQLHVSTDQGRTWNLYSRQRPTAREFPFRATADGLYWFAVQTVGSKLPTAKLKPELVIAIDSAKPNFNVDIKTDALGRLVVGWRAADENLDPASLKIAYQTAAAWGQRRSTWQQVQLPKPDPSIQKVYDDQVAFYADTSNIVIDLRISIADKAGNVAILDRRYNLPRTALQRKPNATTNVAQRLVKTTPSKSSRYDSSRPPSIDPYSAVTQSEKDRAARNVGLNSAFDMNSEPQSSLNQSRISSSKDRKNGWNFVDNSGFNQDFHSNRPNENELIQNRDQDAPGSINDPSFQNPNRLATSRRPVGSANDSSQSGTQIDRIPDGEYAKLSSSKKFELDYHVEHIQADDISRLEIWVTRDGGQSWKLNSVDPDRQSPVAIEVAEDGVYGYRIRIQTVDGLESVQPTKGDSADVWVEVDTTKPSVELTSVPYGRRVDAGKLIINWRATDRRLASKPVTLYYAVGIDGPWQVIVEKLPNSSQFKWPVTNRVPRKVYIRIEAVDAAGNRNFHQTEQPIDLSGLNPRGMIRAVRPID